MKKNLFAFLAVLWISINSCLAQDKVIDLSAGEKNGLTIQQNTLTTRESNGKIYFPLVDYGKFSGIKFNISNFEKLETSASDTKCALNIVYKAASGEDSVATWNFYAEGKKNLKFSEWKGGNESINIDPSTIKTIFVSVGKGKKVDLTLSLVSK
jgi:hypothetical protein